MALELLDKQKGLRQTVLKRLVSIVLLLTLTACGGSRAIAPIGSYKSKSTQKAPSSYTVKSGDTLYSISWRYGMDYKTVASINNIRAPYTIFVGQKLRFSGSYKPSKKVTTRTTSRAYSSKKATAPTKKTSTKTTTPTYAANRTLTWKWPVYGNIISTYSESAAGRKGIDIAGKSGQSIKAAAAGKVVYSGNGLARYGNLIIIKHNDAYLSAYAHNKALLVKEGQNVQVGQKIATLGRTGTQRNQLHFEIRRNGKPVDPMRFLPKR